MLVDLCLSGIRRQRRNGCRLGVAFIVTNIALITTIHISAVYEFSIGDKQCELSRDGFRSILGVGFVILCQYQVRSDFK